MRAETGPMKFGDDWTGVFIRGDNAFNYGLMLRRIMTDTKVSPFDRALLEGLASTLLSADEQAPAGTYPEPQNMMSYIVCIGETE